MTTLLRHTARLSGPTAFRLAAASWAALGCWSVGPHRAAAQELALPAPSDAAPTASPVVAPPAPTAQAAARNRCESAGADLCWTQATGALAQSQLAEAHGLLRSFASLYPVDARAQLAASFANALESSVVQTREARITRQSGRVEAIISGSLYGASLGTQVGIGATDSNVIEANLIPLFSLAGLGTGLWAAYTLTQDVALSDAQSRVLTSGWLWGYAVGGSLLFAADANSGYRYDDVTGEQSREGAWGPFVEHPNLTLAVSSLAGAVAGAAIAAHEPDLASGDVALTNAGGLWVPTTMMLVYGVLAGNSGGERAASAIPLVGIPVGLAAGAWSASAVDVSAQRVWLVSLAGGVGLLAGGAAIASADPSDSSAIFGALLAGEAAGLGAGILLTAGDDDPAPVAAAAPPSTLLAPAVWSDGKQQYTGLQLLAHW